MTRRIVLAGGNGFIGRLLVKSFVAGNYEVVILTRSPVAGETAIRQVRWDGRTLGDWAGELEGAHALINLAGRSVNCRYNARNRREILESRVQSTKVLGGAIAGGRQFISWIHEADFCRSVEWLMHRDDFSGPVNVASPNPIPQREMMRIIRRECGVPFGLSATRRMLEVAAFIHRTEAELILKSRRVVPSRLLAEGFQFRFPRMEDAVRDIESRL